ncbi:Similar to fau: 40S ribosomal protein S30 (Oryzias latipes) [Cotesia congregata]|uniref:Similar to fau: 40S ribosomal protein S30 (Oryzias latipes) n=1 Tax=Cotesia congregata TaxID=51543 RepID=A0A8J2HQK6_COTCN|nr:Similar to fau: 40S ribosomal protein S30 (Oryzias latipes) [Cotesia congregata]
MSLMRKKIFLCQVDVDFCFCFRFLLRPCLLHEEQINKMQLFIRGQETFVVECQEHEIVSNLKAKITEACDFGSTEFVEKQEKSKKKTGRAKRRIQYNRRFVTVVPTFGRRRGPNANPQS